MKIAGSFPSEAHIHINPTMSVLCKVQYRLDTSPLTHTSLSDSISMLTLIQVHWLSCFFSNVTSKLSPQDNSIRCFLCLEALFLTSKMLLKYLSSKLTLITLFKIRTNIPFQHYWSLPFALNLIPGAVIIIQLYTKELTQQARLLSLESLAHKVSPSLISRNLDFRRILTFPKQITMALYN